MLQEALVLSTIGSNLHLINRPIPAPSDSEVLIKILISSINPHDAASKSDGLFVKDSLPSSLAIEAIGKVTALGPNVTKFAVGDVILAYGDPTRPDEQYSQEYGIVTITQAAKVPLNVSLDGALTFPLNAQTSFFALFHASGFGLPPSFISNSTYPPFRLQIRQHRDHRWRGRNREVRDRILFSGRDEEHHHCCFEEECRAIKGVRRDARPRQEPLGRRAGGCGPRDRWR